MSFQKFTCEHKDTLIATAKAMVAKGKGLLAADESTGTIGKRFSAINLENVEENRKAYRELLVKQPKEWAESISGIILFEETLNQDCSCGKSMVHYITQAGVIPGIKVDKGVVPLLGTFKENSTQGLDGLADRLKGYASKGARFAKWRSTIRIDPSNDCPSELAIKCNAHGLARYASICQQNGIVPIVEPEVLMDGNHSIETTATQTQRVLEALFKEMGDHHCLLEGALLKVNMCLDGSDFTGTKATPEEVAKYTLACLKRSVPAALGGIVFLSGGQSEEEATVNLNAINVLANKETAPWALTFSYGRALQATCIKTWNGKKENIQAAQTALLVREKSNGLAAMGEYEATKVSADAMKPLFEKNYSY
jgi:fructose-bisphosphate aldolase class I